MTDDEELTRLTYEQSQDALIAQLRSENVRLRSELEKVNNEFGCQTSDWPDAWRRVAQVKEDSGRHWREAERLQRSLDERDASFIRMKEMLRIRRKPEHTST